MAAIFRRHFQMHFLEWKCLNFDEDSLKFVPKGQINNIPPGRRQAIIWTNDG